MRYITAALYALAIGSRMSEVTTAWLTAGCVFIGTVLMAFAIEGIVRHEVIKALRDERRGPLG